MILFVTPQILYGGDGANKIKSVVTADNGIITGNTLPKWGQVCGGNVGVHGSPRDEAVVEYTIRNGAVVRLYELSRSDSSWVMIDSAEWIRLSDVCAFQER